MATPVRRILIADDHDILRRGLRALLESRRDIQVVAEAATGREALMLARTTQPDIAIVDYSLPELNGRDLTAALKREFPKLQVLIFTMHSREDIIADVMRAGARGYVLKSASEKHLFAAIDTLSLNRPYFSNSVPSSLFEQYVRGRPQDSGGSLTTREREVVRLISEGKINKQVADVLSISVKTVETHRATAMHKLSLRTTAELVRYALRNHIVEA